MFFANASKMQMVRPENALPGRPDPLPLTEPHFLSGIDLKSRRTRPIRKPAPS
jgi:peptide-methionine (S)-S-oxide reductase